MISPFQTTLVMSCLLTLTACDKGASPALEEGEVPGAVAPVDTIDKDPAEERAILKNVKLIDEDVHKKDEAFCDRVLTPEMVKEALGTSVDKKGIQRSTVMKRLCNFKLLDMPSHGGAIIVNVQRDMERALDRFESDAKEFTAEQQQGFSKQFADLKHAKDTDDSAVRELTKDEAKVKKELDDAFGSSMVPVPMGETREAVADLGDAAFMMRQVTQFKGKTEVSYQLIVRVRNAVVSYTLSGYEEDEAAAQKNLIALAKLSVPQVNAL